MSPSCCHFALINITFDAYYKLILLLHIFFHSLLLSHSYLQMLSLSFDSQAYYYSQTEQNKFPTSGYNIFSLCISAQHKRRSVRQKSMMRRPVQYPLTFLKLMLIRN